MKLGGENGDREREIGMEGWWWNCTKNTICTHKIVIQQKYLLIHLPNYSYDVF